MMPETAVQNFEQSCQRYEMICMYCGIAAIVFLALTIILFFSLHIPQVFGELTGRTARREVQQMTDSNLQRDKSVAGKKGSRVRAYHDLDGKNDTPVSLMAQEDAVTRPIMKKMPEVAFAETGPLQPKKVNISVPEQPQRGVCTQASSAEWKKEFVVLRSMVVIHTNEVIEQ